MVDLGVDRPVTDRPTMDGLRPTLPAGADRSVARRWAERATTVLAVCALVPTLARTTMLLVDALQDPARGTLRFVVELLLNLAVSLAACSLGVRAWERRRRWPVEETPLFLLVFAPLAYHSLNVLLRHTGPLTLPWSVVLAVSGVLNAAAVVVVLYLAGATVAARSGLPGEGRKAAPTAALRSSQRGAVFVAM
jgi:hypothetical protein